MTILTVMRDVCYAVGVNPPTSIISAATQPRTQAEMLSLANEMAQRIAYDVREWGVLKATAEIIGDGVTLPPPPDPGGVPVGTTAFNLPSNFKRMLLSSSVWRSNQPRVPMRFIPDTDEWLQRRLNGHEDTHGEWTIIGGQMHIHPMLMMDSTAGGSPQKATFVYLDKNCVKLGAGGFGDRFLRDDDEFRISERVLKLGMIWQWKANKGSPYAEDMGTYSDALVMDAGADTPAPIIVGDGRQRWVDAYHVR